MRKNALNIDFTACFFKEFLFSPDYRLCISYTVILIVCGHCLMLNRHVKDIYMIAMRCSLYISEGEIF